MDHEFRSVWMVWIDVKPADLDDEDRPKALLSLSQQLWDGLSNAVRSFCLAAGCSKADRRDPFKSIEGLRDLISRQLAYTTICTIEYQS